MDVKNSNPPGEVWNDRRFQMESLEKFKRACMLLERILAHLQQPENKNITIERKLKK